MEVTIKLTKEQVDVINNVGRDKGDLNRYVGGYFWGDEMDECNTILVNLRKEINGYIDCNISGECDTSDYITGL